MVAEFQGIRPADYPTNARGASSGLKLQVASAMGPRSSYRKGLAPTRLRSRMSFLRGLADVFDLMCRKDQVYRGIFWLTWRRYRSFAVGTKARFLGNQLWLSNLREAVIHACTVRIGTGPTRGVEGDKSIAHETTCHNISTINYNIHGIP